MSYADKVFKENLLDIFNNGTDTRGQKVRPRWEDGTPAFTFKKFGVVNKYDLRKEFPAITIRPTAIKSCMDEILWIFQRKSNNIHDLKPHIWDEWANEDGSIGKAYGYQIGSLYKHHKVNSEPVNDMVSMFPSYTIDGDYVLLDQIDAVLYDLKFNPFSRRILTSIWNFEELNEMNLQPCCWNCTFNVTDENGKLTLNMVLNQRSNDMIAANNWNVCQYAILLMMIAQVSNMEAGELVHVITDQHIYDRHIPIAKTLLDREEFPAPTVKLNKNITNFYDFTTSDIEVIDYKTCDQIKDIPIAI